MKALFFCFCLLQMIHVTHEALFQTRNADGLAVSKPLLLTKEFLSCDWVKQSTWSHMIQPRVARGFGWLSYRTLNRISYRNTYRCKLMDIVPVRIAHAQYIKSLTWPWAFIDKTANFQHCFASHKRLALEENQTKYRRLTIKPRSHDRILIYRTWAIKRVPVANQYMYR